MRQKQKGLPDNISAAQKGAVTLDTETKERIDMVNRGLLFKQTHEEISSGTYFAKKYDLNYQVSNVAERTDATKTTSAPRVPVAPMQPRKRDSKADSKSKLMFKYL